MKRILCLLLTLVLLVGMMPVPALASEDITEGGGRNPFGGTGGRTCRGTDGRTC